MDGSGGAIVTAKLTGERPSRLGRSPTRLLRWTKRSRPLTGWSVVVANAPDSLQAIGNMTAGVDFVCLSLQGVISRLNLAKAIISANNG